MYEYDKPIADISTSSLKRVHEDRKKAQRNTYKKIYLQICEKIRKVNKQFYMQHCTYHVPVMMWGLPLYKMEECLIYVRWRLKKKSIQTKFVYPNTLYISWENIVEETSIENVAKKDEEYSKDHSRSSHSSHTSRWDHRLIDEKNDQTIEDQKLREDFHRKDRRRQRKKREERDYARRQRHKQEEIEEIIKRKNKQALLALEFGLEDDKPKTKVLQITT
jgi:hypothetical protein